MGSTEGKEGLWKPGLPWGRSQVLGFLCFLLMISALCLDWVVRGYASSRKLPWRLLWDPGSAGGGGEGRAGWAPWRLPEAGLFLSLVVVSPPKELNGAFATALERDELASRSRRKRFTAGLAPWKAPCRLQSWGAVSSPQCASRLHLKEGSYLTRAWPSLGSS